MFFGREHELTLLQEAVRSNRAELVILYGRRRVGKSTLLQQIKIRRGKLYFEALQNARQPAQIVHFLRQLAEQTEMPLSAARNWHEAFEALTFHVRKGKHLVVMDEFPWMASGRGEIVSLLKYFWDNHWKHNPGLTLVLCGSIAAFMIKQIVHSKALHNRKTIEIKLAPLTALETKPFFRDLRSDREIIKFLMIFGGIPKYLEQIDPRKSLAANLDRLCFQRHGFFLTEFETVFKEQFKVARTYERIVRILAHRGCSREELARHLGIVSGGGLSSYLHALEQADFIRTAAPLSIAGGGQKTRKLVLWDEWLRFYFTWIEPNRELIEMEGRTNRFDPFGVYGLDAYFGLCFERLCMKNLPQIFARLELDFRRVTGFGPFFRQRRRKKERDEGLQIDLLVRQKGHVLTLIECKFTARPVGTTVIDEVARKIKFLGAPSHYTVERVLISAGGVTPDLARSDYFHQIAGLETIL